MVRHSITHSMVFIALIAFLSLHSQDIHAQPVEKPDPTPTDEINSTDEIPGLDLFDKDTELTLCISGIYVS